MLATFLLGLAAGWFAPRAEAQVQDGIKRILLTDSPLTALELRMISFAACMLGAAILSMIFGDPHAVVLAAGAFLGVLAPRLQETYRKSRNPDYDS
ncbi:MAG: hypothetical protein AAFW64_04915 [Pseudomonadota bacterium]